MNFANEEILPAENITIAETHIETGATTVLWNAQTFILRKTDDCWY
jgi:hypothetical protein